MCDSLFHTCKFCGSDYVCELDNYLCPSINHDKNELMCALCAKKEQEDFSEWLGSEADKGQSVSLEDWENK